MAKETIDRLSGETVPWKQLQQKADAQENRRS